MVENNEIRELVDRAFAGDAGAQYRIGMIYAAHKNPDCMEWLLKAYENGLRDAAFNIGVLYDMGEIVEQNYADALKWYRIAAEEESENGAKAQYAISSMYYNGTGVAKDLDEHKKWVLRCSQKASRLGCNNAFFADIYYLAGLGLEDEDESVAIYWMAQAAECGHDEAKQWIKNYYSVDSKNSSSQSQKSGGCYVATAVYGSYDCPEVWTLRRFRDYTLAETWYGRAFIKVYYAVSPPLVKWFGETKWFQRLWKGRLDHLVEKLRANGVEDTPYADRDYH